MTKLSKLHVAWVSQSSKSTYQVLKLPLFVSGVFGVEQTNHKTNNIPDEVAAMLNNTSANGGGEDSD